MFEEFKDDERYVRTGWSYDEVGDIENGVPYIRRDSEVEHACNLFLLEKLEGATGVEGRIEITPFEHKSGYTCWKLTVGFKRDPEGERLGRIVTGEAAGLSKAVFFDAIEEAFTDLNDEAIAWRYHNVNRPIPEWQMEFANLIKKTVLPLPEETEEVLSFKWKDFKNDLLQQKRLIHALKSFIKDEYKGRKFKGYEYNKHISGATSFWIQYGFRNYKRLLAHNARIGPEAIWLDEVEEIIVDKPNERVTVKYKPFFNRPDAVYEFAPEDINPFNDLTK